MRILCLIPARAGSRGIRKKNTVLVAGIPLIVYSIRQGIALKNAGLVARVVVSTDGNEIARIAKDHGAEVPFLRDAELATDTTKSVDVILHALDFYADQDEQFDAVLLLQPTSPLRRVDELRRSIEVFQAGSAESLISVYVEEYVNDLVMYRTHADESLLTPLNVNHNKGVRRQDHGTLFVRNGAIYLTKVALLRKRMIIADKPLFIEMPKIRSINVDTQEDLEELRKRFE